MTIEQRIIIPGHVSKNKTFQVFTTVNKFSNVVGGKLVANIFFAIYVEKHIAK
jgi:hypothetical protein